MPELLSAGVYIEERPSGQANIPGVSTSNFAAAGWTQRGPANEATLVTSWEQFVDTFGSYTRFSDLALAITAFFQNEGKRAYITRIVPDDAVKAQIIKVGLWKFLAISEGEWGNLVRVIISGNSNYYDVATAMYSKFDVLVQEESYDGAGDFSTKEQYEALVLDDVNHKDYITKVVNDQSPRIRIEDISPTGGIPTEFLPTSVSGESVGTGTGAQQTFNVTLAQPSVAKDSLFVFLAGVSGAVAEDDGSGNMVGSGVSGTINYDTGYMHLYFVTPPGSSVAITANYFKAGVEYIGLDLLGGSDGSPETIGRSQISDPALQPDSKGIYAMDKVEEMFAIGIPDFSDDMLVSLDLISYCENRKDAFAILDVPTGYTPQQALRYKRTVLNSLSNYAGMYYPKITVADPLNDSRAKNMSSVGHVAGVFARTDNNRNVGKAPAGVNDGRLNFAIGLERVLTRGEMDLIYPANINPLWSNTATGRVVWGSRTLQISGDFTQVNARRLFQFLEKSVFNSTHDVVFENLNSSEYSKLKLRLESFFLSLFEEGYFKGAKPSDAFDIIIDESNNTPAIVKARQLIIDYYVAVNEPGEFIRHRFQRKFD